MRRGLLWAWRGLLVGALVVAIGGCSDGGGSKLSAGSAASAVCSEGGAYFSVNHKTVLLDRIEVARRTGELKSPPVETRGELWFASWREVRRISEFPGWRLRGTTMPDEGMWVAVLSSDEGFEQQGELRFSTDKGRTWRRGGGLSENLVGAHFFDEHRGFAWSRRSVSRTEPPRVFRRLC